MTSRYLRKSRRRKRSPPEPQVTRNAEIVAANNPGREMNNLSSLTPEILKNKVAVVNVPSPFLGCLYTGLESNQKRGE
jgi:hypothetical protein